MQIFVKLGSSDELLTLDAESSNPTIKDIKALIKDKKHIPLEQQCLFFKGRELKDYKDAVSGNVDAKSSAVRAEDVERENLTVSYYKIPEGDVTLQLGLIIHCSTTVQSVFALDKVAMTYQCFFEFDFKYDMARYVQLFDAERADKPYKSSDAKVPWIITNARSHAIMNENHFFRVKSDPQESTEMMSIYGTPGNVKYTVPMEQIQSMSVVKYEKYSMSAELRYLTTPFNGPWDEIFALIKVTTNGHPGTEFTKFVFSGSADNSGAGFDQPLGEYTGKCFDAKIGRKEETQFMVDFSNEQHYKGDQNMGKNKLGYARMYIIHRFGLSPSSRWLEIFKFFVIPSLLYAFLCFVYAGYSDGVDGEMILLNDGGSKNITQVLHWMYYSGHRNLNQNGALSFIATFILADVGLLFVATSNNGITYSKISLICNMFGLIGLAIFKLTGFYYGSPDWFQRTVILTVSLWPFSSS